VRQLAQRHHQQQAVAPLLDEHPLIRPLTEYGQLVAVAAWDAVLGAGEPSAQVSPAPNPPPLPSLSLSRMDGLVTTRNDSDAAEPTRPLPNPLLNHSPLENHS
jgi:hypothetical protein